MIADVTNDARTNILLVEDDPAGASLILEALASTADSPFRAQWVRRLSEALERLGGESIDVVLLDLTLPDGQGIEVFDQVFQAARNALILVLSAAGDEETARQVVQRGAHDYFIKDHLDAHWLPRALRYAIERKLAQDALRTSEARFRAMSDASPLGIFVSDAQEERAQVTLNSIGDAVLTTDLLGNVTYLNLVAERMTGWSREEASGHPLSEVFKIIDGATRQAVANPAQRAIWEDRTVGLPADCVLVRRDGFEAAIEDSVAPIHNRDGRVAGTVIVFRDVSQSRAMALKMSHLAQHDFLTGLPNRVLLTERLSQAIGLARRHRKQVALLFLDLDYFKHINDSLGHEIGDQMLQSVAYRLAACVRASDTVCRQGGDEFVILLAEIEHPQDAAHVAEKLRAEFATPHRIGGRELHVTLSIGISVYPDNGHNVGLLMQSADSAMYHAKAKGRNNHQFFRAGMKLWRNSTGRGDSGVAA